MLHKIFKFKKNFNTFIKIIILVLCTVLHNKKIKSLIELVYLKKILRYHIHLTEYDIKNIHTYIHDCPDNVAA